MIRNTKYAIRNTQYDWKALARAILGRLNQPLASRRLRWYLQQTPPPYRVQVGSGLVQREGWLNTDIGHRARYWLDIGRPLPFPTGSVSYLFSEHVVEHVAPDVVTSFLHEAYRVLAPGGVLRILTPDAEATAREYVARSALTFALVDRARRLGYRSLSPVDTLNLTFHANGHVYIWDEESLRAALHSAGFERIQRWQVGASDFPELAMMDGHFAADDPAIAFTLVLEATR